MLYIFKDNKETFGSLFFWILRLFKPMVFTALEDDEKCLKLSIIIVFILISNAHFKVIKYETSYWK